MRSKQYSNLFALSCLIGTVWASVATSKMDGGFYGTYRVSSDCVTPTIQQNITISDSSTFDFTTLGFPEISLTRGMKSTGSVNGKTRVCENTLEEGDVIDDSFLYTCSDDGQYVCNVYFGNL